MRNLKYIGVSKSIDVLGIRIGTLCPVGTYYNSCNISNISSLYIDDKGNIVHDVTFIESDLEIYKDIRTNEYKYIIVK